MKLPKLNRAQLTAVVVTLVILALLTAVFWVYLNQFYYVTDGLIPRRGRCMYPCVGFIRAFFVNIGLSPF